MLDPSRIPEYLHPAGQGVAAALAPARPAMLSVAAEVPSTRVTTAELAERLGVTEDWIVSRTGIRERPVAAPDERLSDFAAEAGRRFGVRIVSSPTCSLFTMPRRWA